MGGGDYNRRGEGKREEKEWGGLADDVGTWGFFSFTLGNLESQLLVL